MIERRPRAPVSRERVLGDLPERVLGEDELDRVVAEEALILAHERVLGLRQDLHEVVACQLMHRETTGRRPTNSGMRPKVMRSRA